MRTSVKRFDPLRLVLCCNHVLDDERPVLLVVHESDGDWQFLCGYDDHDFSNALGGAQLHVRHLVEKDPKLNDVAGLPCGWQAERAAEDFDWVLAAAYSD